MPLVRCSDVGDFPGDLFIQVTHNGVATLHPVGARRVHEQVNIYADQWSHGDPEALVNRHGFADMQDIWRAWSHRVAKERPVFKRLGWLPEDESIWLDLSQADGRCVEITAAGWRVDEPLHPLFVRHASQRPLPLPEQSDDGEAAFHRILPPGISAEDAKLLMGALLGCLVPAGFARAFSYPILIVTGDSGAGKSTLCKLIKELIDNQCTTTAAKPSKIDDLYVAAQTSHLLSYDNVDFIKGNLSDAICQLTTGSAVAKRRLYTDGDQTILKAKAALLLNGISPEVPRQDLLDRSITIRLKRIAQYDADAGRHADADLPLVLGYLCTLMSRSLANYSRVALVNPPRLALIAKIAAAAEPFGAVDTPFVDLLKANQHEALTTTQDNDPVIDALFELLAGQVSWTGTYKELLQRLILKVDHSTTLSHEWPRTPHKLAAFIREHARLLRELSISCVNGPKHNNGRIVTVSRQPGFVPAHDVPF